MSRLTALNLALITDVQRRKARWRLLPVLVGASFNVAVGGWLTNVFARFWLAHLDMPSSLVAGMALHAASVGLVIMGAVQLLLVTRINFAQPVLTIQRYLALLQAWEARSFRWAWLGAWLLWPALLVAGAMAIAGVDLWARAPGVVLVNVAAGVGGALLSVVFDRIARRPGGRLGAWMERLLTNQSVKRAKVGVGRDRALWPRLVAPLHVAPVLPAHFVQRMRDLAERAHLHGLEQLFEHVATFGRDLLQARERGRRLRCVTRLE